MSTDHAADGVHPSSANSHYDNVDRILCRHVKRNRGCNAALFCISLLPVCAGLLFWPLHFLFLHLMAKYGPLILMLFVHVFARWCLLYPVLVDGVSLVRVVGLRLHT